ncbi:hypothetical protein HYPSUDRAFT_209178 [Hypholoma sublateritium FD-334 SS-4]|uniref:Uncharacterized protein n=1 Tax=Hypholoma sublateritium (strain FD-334 SS-4) TaxID=945553 RepID=A0A0D2NBC8_HYPSF|nr:hypothetical protein HYPSUDRAFT_209178 [Hypholoma sublateritium FD-334 SS-4]
MPVGDGHRARHLRRLHRTCAAYPVALAHHAPFLTSLRQIHPAIKLRPAPYEKARTACPTHRLERSTPFSLLPSPPLAPGPPLSFALILRSPPSRPSVYLSYLPSRSALRPPSLLFIEQSTKRPPPPAPIDAERVGERAKYASPRARDASIQPTFRRTTPHHATRRPHIPPITHRAHAVPALPSTAHPRRIQTTAPRGQPALERSPPRFEGARVPGVIDGTAIHGACDDDSSRHSLCVVSPKILKLELEVVLRAAPHRANTPARRASHAKKARVAHPAASQPDHASTSTSNVRVNGERERT